MTYKLTDTENWTELRVIYNEQIMELLLNACTSKTCTQKQKFTAKVFHDAKSYKLIDRVGLQSMYMYTVSQKTPSFVIRCNFNMHKIREVKKRSSQL